jgi:hypothetical protein
MDEIKAQWFVRFRTTNQQPAKRIANPMRYPSFGSAKQVKCFLYPAGHSFRHDSVQGCNRSVHLFRGSYGDPNACRITHGVAGAYDDAFRLKCFGERLRVAYTDVDKIRVRD